MHFNELGAARPARAMTLRKTLVAGCIVAASAIAWTYIRAYLELTGTLAALAL